MPSRGARLFQPLPLNSLCSFQRLVGNNITGLGELPSEL